jgi:trehalose 6-phosphate phosphatase
MQAQQYACQQQPALACGLHREHIRRQPSAKDDVMASKDASAAVPSKAERERKRAPAPPHTLPLVPAWALFLDVDGTLCPLRDEPDAVALSNGQRAMLRELSHRLRGAICALSGRSGEDLDRILADVPMVRVGEHGHDVDAQPDASLDAELECVEHAMRKLRGLHESIWVERKRSCCALHYRRNPELAESLTVSVRQLVHALPSLRLLEGRDVLEVTAAGSDKGRALRAVMQRPPFAGRCPVAVGDDVSDDDAFEAAAALGGFGVAVGPRRASAAAFHLRDAHAVDEWLIALAQSPPEGYLG